MIECPFCNEQYSGDDLVFEFRWIDIANHYYNRKKLSNKPQQFLSDRTIYISFLYDTRGNTYLKHCSTVANPKRDPGKDPLLSDENEWDTLVDLLSEKNVFEVECESRYPDIPTQAVFSPLKRIRRKQETADIGVSTGVFCPFCEQQLKADVLNPEEEIRIVLVGRRGSGKTVYVTQLISELRQGRYTPSIRLDPANRSVTEHYSSNQQRLEAYAEGFVKATNPGGTQDPYVFILSTRQKNIRLIIQDIAGEDTENRIKYNNVVRKADMVLFFIDPWQIGELREVHKRRRDETVSLVEQSTGGTYYDLNGVFETMLSNVDRDFTHKKGQMAGVLLVKGDYLIPPMLSRGSQPECQMMRLPISFDRPEQMEFDIGLRSSFVRQCMNEWRRTRIFINDVEGKYPASNTRYFAVSALGRPTHLQNSFRNDGIQDEFSDSEASRENWDYGGQVLDSTAQPEHVIDPVLWCLKRKGIPF